MSVAGGRNSHHVGIVASESAAPEDGGFNDGSVTRSDGGHDGQNGVLRADESRDGRVFHIEGFTIETGHCNGRTSIHFCVGGVGGGAGGAQRIKRMSMFFGHVNSVPAAVDGLSIGNGVSGVGGAGNLGTFKIPLMGGISGIEVNMEFIVGADGVGGDVRNR